MILRTALLCAWLGCSLSFGAAAQTVTIGETAVLTAADGDNGNLLVAQEASLSQPATIQSMSFYVTGAAGRLVLGIYKANGPSGGPGTLVAQTAAFTPQVGWNVAATTTTPTLAAGPYWLAYLPSDGGLAFVKQNNSGNCYYYSHKFTSILPQTFSTRPRNCTPTTWSFYATLTASSDPSVAVNGQCGSANGVTVSSAPATNLCSAGTASAVTGNGPWNWSCAGSNGGTTASCSAPPAAVNGSCGTANGTAASTAPSTGLCSVGLASSVAGTGPWNWTCNGSNGGTTASCRAAQAGKLGALFPAMGMQASSVYPWAQYPPGVTYNGGIPVRTKQCGPTLTPLGGGQSDAAQIRAAIGACPAGQYVQLGAGVFIINGGSADEAINIGYNPTVNNITIRGVGPGPGGAIPSGQTAIPTGSQCGATPCTIIFKKNWQIAGTNGIININYGGASSGQIGQSVNLAADALQGSTTLVLASVPDARTQAFHVGALAIVDMQTEDPNTGLSTYPDVYISPAFHRCAACYGWFSSRPYRHEEQIVKITAINGNTITIDRPLSISMLMAYNAQFTTYTATTTISHGIGIEDIYFYGGGGGQGNITISLCDSCYVRHIESHWAMGAIQLSSCYLCEIRDSYIHENGAQQGRIAPGGNGYLTALNVGTFGSLLENNIIWYGDKVDLVRSGGGGNVIAYNYMDDTFNGADPVQPEAGVNDSHYVGSHMDLIEGNWSHQLTGDSWWGNSTYVTVFRNWLTGLRGARHGLATYTVNNAGTVYPYCDCWTRGAVFMQTRSDWYNIVGNVLGFNGQTLLYGYQWSDAPDFMATQTSWSYENLTGTADGTVNVSMWTLGNSQDNGPPPDPTQYQRDNRQGNFDWVTQSQIWYAGMGGFGTTSTGQPQTLPNSMYLTSKPAFFGSMTWPWVNPSNGTTYTLPAKARFDAGTPNDAVGGAAPLQ